MITLDDTLQLHALLDGELELARQLELETRLRDDAALREELRNLERERDAVRAEVEYHHAPAALRARLAARHVGPASAADRHASAGAGGIEARRRRAWVPAAAASAFALVLASVLVSMPRQVDRDERLAREAVSSHVRATLGQHLVDVVSSDQHTVKPWLSARLDFSPPVHDVPVAGVVFLGGRVDYLDGHPVAVLVYRQRQHVVDAFIWPDDHRDTASSSLAERGFNAVHWTRAGMTHWVVSDLNREELVAFAQALDSGAAPGPVAAPAAGTNASSARR